MLLHKIVRFSISNDAVCSCQKRITPYFIKILKMEIAKNVFGVRTNDGYSGKADAGIILHSFDRL